MSQWRSRNANGLRVELERAVVEPEKRRPGRAARRRGRSEQGHDPGAGGAWLHNDAASTHVDEFWSRAKDAISGDVYGIDLAVVDWDLAHSLEHESLWFYACLTAGHVFMRDDGGAQAAYPVSGRGGARGDESGAASSDGEDGEAVWRLRI